MVHLGAAAALRGDSGEPRLQAAVVKRRMAGTAEVAVPHWLLGRERRCQQSVQTATLAGAPLRVN